MISCPSGEEIDRTLANATKLRCTSRSRISATAKTVHRAAQGSKCMVLLGATVPEHNHQLAARPSKLSSSTWDNRLPTSGIMPAATANPLLLNSKNTCATVGLVPRDSRPKKVFLLWITAEEGTW